jgi:hypothetical protein
MMGVVGDGTVLAVLGVGFWADGVERGRQSVWREINFLVGRNKVV